MKKFVIAVISVVLVASLFVGCGANEDAQNTENAAVTESTVEDTSAAGETTALTEAAVADTTAVEEIITETTAEETTAEVTVPEETTAVTQESTTETTTYFVDNPNALPWG